jgi:hypothetical protein
VKADAARGLTNPKITSAPEDGEQYGAAPNHLQEAAKESLTTLEQHKDL